MYHSIKTCSEGGKYIVFIWEVWEVSQPALVGSHLILPGSNLGEMEIFHINTRK